MSWQSAQQAEQAYWRFKRAELEQVSDQPYYTHFQPFWDELKTLLPDDLTTRNDLRLLDIGCGPITFLERFPGQPKRVAVDTLLDFYQKNFSLPPDIDYRNGLTHKVCPPGEQFDVVFLMNVLDHLEDPAVLLQEIDRLLAPGGWFVSSENCFNTTWGKHYFDRHGWVIDPAHLWHFSREDIEHLCGRWFTVAQNPVCIDGPLMRANTYTGGAEHANLLRNLRLSWPLLVPLAWRWPWLLPLAWLRFAKGCSWHAEPGKQASLLSRWLFVHRKPETS